ncbi:hypothetical protein K438DRAFT_1847238 [Mycena galopus ATCC 62051]|nr:hypothetical protein K438DRAFT_1847238 [Mycena galopus ATCC 62051]
MEAKPKSCYKCGQEGHIVRAVLLQLCSCTILGPLYVTALTGFSLLVGNHTCPRALPFPPSLCCFPFPN